MSLLGSPTQSLQIAWSRLTSPCPGRGEGPNRPRRYLGEARLLHRRGQLTFDDAENISRYVLRKTHACRIVLDLAQAAEASTAALARLVQLRGDLLRTGRDLLLTNLKERVASRWEVNRLMSVLPLL